VVVKGTAEVTVGNDMRDVHENESIYIPIGSIHRLANPGKIPLELIEVQVGSYLGGRWIAPLAPANTRLVLPIPASAGAVRKTATSWWPVPRLRATLPARRDAARSLIARLLHDRRAQARSTCAAHS
jgi:hypothetical protein